MPATATASPIKYIALNSAKLKKFITKGVNLNMRSPVAAVPPDLDEEFMAKIRTALETGQIFEVPEGEFLKVGIAGQGELEQDEDSEERTVADYGRETLQIRTNPQTGQEERVVNHIFRFRGESDSDEQPVATKPQRRIHLLTDIDSEHDEE